MHRGLPKHPGSKQRDIFALVLVVLALAGLIVANKANADDPSSKTGHLGQRPVVSASPDPSPAASPVKGGDTSSGTTSVSRSGGCTKIVTAVYFGPYCPVAGGGGPGGHLATIKEVLGADAMPGCWDATLTVDQLALYGLRDGTAYDWVLRQCLKWLVPTPVYPYPTDAHIEDELVALPAGSARLTLTITQRALVNLLTAAQGSYPTVLAVPAGSGVARVNQHVAFHGAPSVSKVVQAGAVFMQARVTRLEISPLGTSTPGTSPLGQSPTVSCPGTGTIPPPGATLNPTNASTVCWYTFTRSSADQPNQAYPMSVTATWDVRSSPDANAPWDTWKEENNTIHTTRITNQKVTEIHTVVVN